MQQQQSLVEDSSVDSAVNSGLGKNIVSEDELKSPYALDNAVCEDFYILLFWKFLCGSCLIY